MLGKCKWARYTEPRYMTAKSESTRWKRQQFSSFYTDNYESYHRRADRDDIMVTYVTELTVRVFRYYRSKYYDLLLYSWWTTASRVQRFTVVWICWNAEDNRKSPSCLSWDSSFSWTKCLLLTCERTEQNILHWKNWLRVTKLIFKKTYEIAIKFLFLLWIC